MFAPLASDTAADVRRRLPRRWAVQMDRNFSVRDGSGRYVATAQTLAGAAELVSNSEDLSLRIDYLDRCVFGPEDDECEAPDIVRLITKRLIP